MEGVVHVSLILRVLTLLSILGHCALPILFLREYKYYESHQWEGLDPDATKLPHVRTQG